ncbi:MAG: PAM68 family protein [Cyanobium sp.]
MAGKGIQGPTNRNQAVRKAAGRKLPKERNRGQQVIPDAVANRMARRIAIGTGIPTLMGMGVFIGSYLLVSRQILDVPTGATLSASLGCFFLGVLGLSFGVLSASWEEQPGSLLGTEQIGLNISRMRSSIRSMRTSSGGQQPNSGRQER